MLSMQIWRKKKEKRKEKRRSGEKKSRASKFQKLK